MTENVNLEKYLTTNMRTYYLMAQYQKIAKNQPKGIVILPDPKNIYIWHGLILINSGYYRGGNFRFYIEFPEKYYFLKFSPAEGEHIPLKFAIPVFHPLINPNVLIIIIIRQKNMIILILLNKLGLILLNY